MSDDKTLIKLKRGTNLRRDPNDNWFELWWFNQFAIRLSLEDIDKIHEAAHADAHQQAEKQNDKEKEA